MTSDHYYMSQIRSDFAIQNPNAAYRPGRVSEEGEVVLTDPDSLSRVVELFDKYMATQKDTGGPDLAELEATYRV